MEDICELSSILDQERQEKQRLERELQLIDKAIRNQEGRFENEIEKHQEIGILIIIVLRVFTLCSQERQRNIT